MRQITKKRKKKKKYYKQSKNEGLTKFIRNCPANSSCILISVKRFFISGGCDESFVSPDQILFLRLFSSGNAIFLNENVARMPRNQSSGSLSIQIRRSRYESILALIKFCEESTNVNEDLKRKAYKRALSRAHNYNKHLNKRFFSVHLIMYLISKFYFPENYINLMYSSLRVFNKSHSRKKKWRTGYEKKVKKKYN